MEISMLFCCILSATVVTGTFVPKNFRSRERKFHSLELLFPGTFVLNIKISIELSFPIIDHWAYTVHNF